MNTIARITKWFLLGIAFLNLDAVITSQTGLSPFYSLHFQISIFDFLFLHAVSHARLHSRIPASTTYAVFPQPRDRTRYDTTQLAQLARPSAGSTRLIHAQDASHASPGACEG
jgi:hypothetical protein